MKTKHKLSVKKNNFKLFKHILIIIAFIEGGSVMVCELLGAKLISPYFGSSLYVWASVLAVTLGGLASGYYTGGYFSKKYENTSLLFYILLLAGFFMFIMPFSSKFILEHTINLDVRTGSIISLLLYLFPPLLFFGMTSPIIINILTETRDSSGKSAGTVYSISTIGGIFTTLFTGFYIFPEFGISKPAFFTGGFIIFISLIYFIYKKKYFVLLILLIILFIYNRNKKSLIKSNKSFRVLYQSEGILGQLKIIDHMYYSNYKGWRLSRALLVNNVGQTITDLKHPEFSMWDYPFFVLNATSIYPPESDVLLLGFGGGTMYKQFKRQKFNVDAVELDKRIKDIAIKYFGLNPDINVFVDDARHYIRTINKKYDIIMYDLLLGENPPAHLLTVECFEEVKKILKPDGILIINFSGYITGKMGKASRAIYKTLEYCGFKTDIIATHPTNESIRNLIFLASEKKLDFTKINYTEPDMPKINNLEKYFLNISKYNLSDAVILKDDAIPGFEKIYTNVAVEWKKGWNDFYTKKFIKKDIPVFE